MKNYQHSIPGNLNLVKNVFLLIIFYFLFTVYIPYILVLFLTLSLVLLFVLLKVIKDKDNILLTGILQTLKNITLFSSIFLSVVFFLPVDIVINYSNTPSIVFYSSSNIYEKKLQYLIISGFSIPFFLLIIIIILKQAHSCTWTIHNGKFIVTFSNTFFSESFFIKLDHLHQIIFPVDDQHQSVIYNRRVAIFVYNNYVRRKIPITLTQYDYYTLRREIQELLSNSNCKFYPQWKFLDKVFYKNIPQISPEYLSNKIITVKSEPIGVSYINRVNNFLLLIFSILSLFLSIIFLISIISIFLPQYSYFSRNEFNSGTLIITIFMFLSTWIFFAKNSKKAIMSFGKSYCILDKDQVIIYNQLFSLIGRQFTIPVSLIKIYEYNNLMYLVTDYITFKIIENSPKIA